MEVGHRDAFELNVATGIKFTTAVASRASVVMLVVAVPVAHFTDKHQVSYPGFSVALFNFFHSANHVSKLLHFPRANGCKRIETLLPVLVVRKSGVRR